MSKQKLRFTLKALAEAGYVEHQRDKFIHRSRATTSVTATKKKKQKGNITGWIDDSRNLKNRSAKADMFMKLVKQELDLEVYPEFYFSTERLYRIDYSIPLDVNGQVLKLGIEIDGGIWCKGKSGHSSGTGIKRDQQKASLLASEGWKLLRFEPSELLTLKTLELIRKTAENTIFLP
jgi:very-short-patch-repair endonuclease